MPPSIFPTGLPARIHEATPCLPLVDHRTFSVAKGLQPDAAPGPAEGCVRLPFQPATSSDGDGRGDLPRLLSGSPEAFRGAFASPTPTARSGKGRPVDSIGLSFSPLSARSSAARSGPSSRYSAKRWKKGIQNTALMPLTATLARASSPRRSTGPTRRRLASPDGAAVRVILRAGPSESVLRPTIASCREFPLSAPLGRLLRPPDASAPPSSRDPGLSDAWLETSRLPRVPTAFTRLQSA